MTGGSKKNTMEYAAVTAKSRSKHKQETEKETDEPEGESKDSTKLYFFSNA